jgi:hypothetical protein
MVFGLFGGNNVDISIDLDRNNQPYAPGDTVTAKIQLRSDKEVKAREVRAGLIVQHRYKAIHRSRSSSNDNDTDSEVWETAEDWLYRESLAGEGGVKSGQDHAYIFNWPLPINGPAPCDGEIAKIKYLVKVTIDRKLARDINSEREVRVAFSPTGEYAQAGEYGEPSHAEDALLKLTLPGLELVPGQTIRGRLSVEPNKQFEARGVRVELVRQQIVLEGDRHNRHEKVEQKVQLAPALKLQPAQPLQYDFELTVPADAFPSHQTSHSCYLWLIRGSVDRAMRGDPSVAQVVMVYNSPG